MKDIYAIIKDCLCKVTPPPDTYKETWNMIRKTLTMKDRRGKNPGIIWLMSNRKGGKTFPVTQLLLKMHQEYEVVIGLYRRWGGEVAGYGEMVFRKVFEEDPAYAGWFITERAIKKDSCVELILHRPGEDDKSIESILGYTLSINSADNTKPLSPAFLPIDILFQDEFQANKYCPEETEKFVDLRFTLRRNNQPMPIIMCSNSLDILNPYFEMWRISTEIQSDTKYYHGVGMVGLRFFNEKVADDELDDAFNLACRHSRMIECNIGNEWLNSDTCGVCKPEGWGRSIYYCTLHSERLTMGVRYYPEKEYYYVSRSVDTTCRDEYTLEINGVPDIPLFHRSPAIRTIHDAYGKGKLRFSDIVTRRLLVELII